MSGSNYNVSVCQVLESERVLNCPIFSSYIIKMFMTVKIISTFQIHENDIDLGCTTSCGDKMDVNHFTCVLSFEDFHPNSDSRQALAFIGWYAAF